MFHKVHQLLFPLEPKKREILLEDSSQEDEPHSPKIPYLCPSKRGEAYSPL